MHENVLVIHESKDSLDEIMERFCENTEIEDYREWEEITDWFDVSTVEQIREELGNLGYTDRCAWTGSELPELTDVLEECLYVVNDGIVTAVYKKACKEPQWDWFAVGGRWPGLLVDKNGNKLNNLKKKEFAGFKDVIPFNLIINGEWREGYTKADGEDDFRRWTAELNNIIASLPDDTELTILDFHY